MSRVQNARHKPFVLSRSMSVKIASIFTVRGKPKPLRESDLKVIVGLSGGS